ncbi:MAG: MaoC family dehydratase [Chloroflexi bacterium]|nr:MaoC family dehydratase [Chloroflexota bacterium]OJV97816.1 MAG: acyl dehydratase [Chloroflexi bacterium 54-19]
MTIYFEDFKAGHTWELGSYTLTEESIIEFARQFDPQYFHTDPLKAKESVFGGLVASGWQTLGIYMKLLVNNLINRTASLGSPGMEEIRFLNPVRPGDTLTLSYTLLEVRPSSSRPNMGIARFKGELFNQRREQVLRVVGTGFFGRKPEE